MKQTVTVQIMAGGRSSRMGRDKSQVKLGGKTLLERAVTRWRDWGDALFLSVGGKERECLAPIGVVAVADRYPNCGPLGGLHAGLLRCETEYLLLCAVDTPFLTTELGTRLVEQIGSADACVYTLDGHPQPLFGLYRTTCLAAVERLLEQGEYRMNRLLSEVDTVYLTAEDGAAFRNLNTQEELKRAEQEFVE